MSFEGTQLWPLKNDHLVAEKYLCHFLKTNISKEQSESEWAKKKQLQVK